MPRGLNARDEGYSLVELLVAVVILSVLAAIAIPFYLGQRESAWRSTVTSDVRNTGLSLLSVGQGLGGQAPDGIRIGPSQVSPEDATDPVLVTAISPGVLLAYATDDEQERFCIAGAHGRLDEAPLAIFDSSAVGLVEGCSFDADLDNLLPGGIDSPITIAGRFSENSSYISNQTAEGGFTTGTWGRELLLDGQDLTDGNFELRGAFATYGTTESGREVGGWAVVVHGEDGAHGFNGYTVQLDRGYGGGQLVLRRWVDGSERSAITAVDPPDGFDWNAANDVRVAVQGNTVRMDINGQEALTYEDLTRESGAMGVRTWQGTNLSVDTSQLTVNPS